MLNLIIEMSDYQKVVRKYNGDVRLKSLNSCGDFNFGKGSPMRAEEDLYDFCICCNINPQMFNCG